MIIDEAIKLLKEIDPQPFRLIAGAAELALIKDTPSVGPAVYVITKEEQSSDNQAMFPEISQVCHCDFAAVIVVTNVSDKTGAAATLDIEPLKWAVRRAWLGVQLPSADDVTTHVSGSLVRAGGGSVSWEEVFATSYELRA